MKRRVKAWAWRHSSGYLCCAFTDDAVTGAERVAHHHKVGCDSGTGKIIRVTVEYDDGKAKPKQRKK